MLYALQKAFLHIPKHEYCNQNDKNSKVIMIYTFHPSVVSGFPDNSIEYQIAAFISLSCATTLYLPHDVRFSRSVIFAF